MTPTSSAGEISDRIGAVPDGAGWITSASWLRMAESSASRTVRK